jgi:signal transduction histidine kinase
LEALASRLAQRGSRLFPDDETTRFVTRFPANGDWPDASLPLDVRRNLQLIAIEAMYNAARHARAKRVELGFEREGMGWRMWIHDDGCGLAENLDETRGNGIQNLRLRASAIGGRLSIESAPHKGTRVDVHFETRRTVRASIAR